jgi:hypothetical protein
MVSDFVEGMLFLIAGAVIAIWCLMHFSWDQLGIAFQHAADPEKASMINPFKTSGVKDFNIWYYIILAFSAFYNAMAWQGASGFAAAPKNAHEGRMAGVVSSWRGGALAIIISFLAICAFMVMHNPEYAGIASLAQKTIDGISNPAYNSQATVPIILSHILPLGLMGLLCAVLLAGAVTTDNTYLHSWGTIFIQDVMMPFRKKALAPAQHIRYLRWSIAGVSVFAFFFSLIFRQTQYIYMFFAITGAIFLGGAGSAIVGGLYWKRGTTMAAWVAMIAGSVVAVGGTLVWQASFTAQPVRITADSATQVLVNEKQAVRVGDHWEYPYKFMKRDEWQAVKVVAKTPEGDQVKTVYYAFGEKPLEEPVATGEVPSPRVTVAPADHTLVPVGSSPSTRAFVAIRSINGQWWFAIAMGLSVFLYLVVSLLGRQVCNMDRLLHRGAYAIKSEVAVGDEVNPSLWKKLFGITTEFTRGDKVIYYLTTAWSLFWVANFFVLLAVNLVKIQSDHFWLRYNQWMFYTQLAAGILATIWLCCGGIRDLRDLFRTLATAVRNDNDDGRVADDHHNLGE